MIPVPLDDRCRCPHRTHHGMCLNKATHETSQGVLLCTSCVSYHHGGMAHKLEKVKVDGK